MTPKEIADFAMNTYRELRNRRWTDPVNGTARFGMEFCTEVTQIAVKAKLEENH